MSTLEFLGFRDGEQGKMARVETTGSCGIPLNIHIDNAAEAEAARPGPCRIDVCAIGYDIQIFDSEAAYLAQEDALALIPVGTFSMDGDERFAESPDMLFTGSVMDVEHMPDEPHCCLRRDLWRYAVNVRRFRCRCGRPIRRPSGASPAPDARKPTVEIGGVSR